MMVLYSLLGICLSIALLLSAVARRSVSIAILNFLLCLLPAVIVRPWEAIKAPEAAASDLQSLWTVVTLWSCLFAVSLGGIFVCIILRRSPPMSTSTRRRRRRRRVDASAFSFADDESSGGEKEDSSKKRSRSSDTALQ